MDGRCPLRSLPTDASFRVGRSAVVYVRKPSGFPNQATFVMRQQQQQHENGRRRSRRREGLPAPKTLRVFGNGLVQFMGAKNVERALRATRALAKYVASRCRHHKRPSARSVVDSAPDMTMVGAVAEVAPVDVLALKEALDGDDVFRVVPGGGVRSASVSALHEPTGLLMHFYATGKMVCVGRGSQDAVLAAANGVAIPLAIRHAVMQ